ncbi:hypothetical protein Q3G72_027027 [Acer saccharum]|nr:hypothetical protein Q3G72_027027 [Acer saccharum]
MSFQASIIGVRWSADPSLTKPPSLCLGGAALHPRSTNIEDCRTRYNGDAGHHLCRKKISFPARLICGDCFEVRLDKVLADDAPFDICSCQFAMHYSWSAEANARQALANVSALLRPLMEQCQMLM